MIVNYIAEYIYFIKTLKEDKEDNTWLKYYIASTQIDQRLINNIVNEDFNFT